MAGPARLLLLASLLVASPVLRASSTACAQSSSPDPLRRTAPPAEGSAPATAPRIAHAADQPPAPAPAPFPVAAPPVYVVPPTLVYSLPYVVVGAPYVVLNDGSVAVNFGNGYERVLRPCAAVTGAAPGGALTGRDPLGRIGDPPGIAALRAGTRGQMRGGVPAIHAPACYRVDGAGQLIVLSS